MPRKRSSRIRENKCGRLSFNLRQRHCLAYPSEASRASGEAEHVRRHELALPDEKVGKSVASNVSGCHRCSKCHGSSIDLPFGEGFLPISPSAHDFGCNRFDRGFQIQTDSQHDSVPTGAAPLGGFGSQYMDPLPPEIPIRCCV